MAKKVSTTLKLNLRGGAANPAPPVGPILGQAGVNIMDFCNKYNDLTKERRGEMIPAMVTVYEDRSFDIELRLAPVAAMIMKELNLQQGSGEPNTKKIGELSQQQVETIAQAKLPDLNTNNLESAKQMVIGTARSMGVDVKGVEYVSSMTAAEKFAAQATKAQAAYEEKQEELAAQEGGQEVAEEQQTETNDNTEKAAEDKE